MISNIFYNNSKENREYLNFTLCSLGFFISLFGSSIYTFAIGLYVLRITGSGLSFAVTLIFGIIPMVILNPFAGVLADKFDKKKIVVLMDLLNGLLFMTVYIFSNIYGLNLTIIYISTFIMTIFTTLFNISFEAAMPNIVSERLLMKMNSVSKIINSASTILGPMLGGLVFALVDIRFFILINSISFIFSGITEMFIDFNFNINIKNQNKMKGKINFLEDIKDGIKYLINSKEIIELFSIFITLNFAIGFCISIPLPYIINNVLKLGSEYYGIIQGSFSVGMIIGALVVSKVYKEVPYKKLLFYMSSMMSLLVISIGLPLLFMNKFVNIHYLIYYSIVMVIIGIIISFIDIPLFYILQTIIPDEFRGRVLSIGLSAVKAFIPIALLISGFLINKIAPMYITMTGGITYFGFNIYFFMKMNNKKS